jgi:hypothetical protein
MGTEATSADLSSPAIPRIVGVVKWLTWLLASWIRLHVLVLDTFCASFSREALRNVSDLTLFYLEAVRNCVRRGCAVNDARQVKAVWSLLL